MRTLNPGTYSPWVPSPATHMSSQQAEEPTPVCCWNVCPSYNIDVKRPRTYSPPVIGTADTDSPAAFRTIAPSLTVETLRRSASVPGKGRHLTHRLLIETVAPGRHALFNPLSGAVDLADDDDLDRLRRLRCGEPISLAPDEERRLRERLYLFDDADAEEACLNAAVEGAWGRMTRAQPQMYTLCPTLACNLACGYCFEGDSLTDKPQGVMTDDQVAQAFAAIASLRAGYAAQDTVASGPPWIALFGGEPLLPSTHRAVAAILRHAADDGFLVCATTNGVNLTRFQDLLREYADILTVFQVTLDGPRAVHDARRHRLGGQGTFDEVVRGIDLLLSLGIDVDLRVNLDAANVDALPELVDFIHDRGWQAHAGFALALAPVTVNEAAGGCRSRYDKALSELELTRRVMALRESHPRVAALCHLGFLRHLEYLASALEPARTGPGRRGTTAPTGPRYWYCEASTDKQYVLTPEGLIYNCTEAVGQPRHAVGRFDPALELWAGERGEWVGRTILSHPKCRACSISTLCGGGCHIAARDRASQGGEGSVAEDLLQIALPGHRPATHIPARPEPYCNAAEETVRAYLRVACTSAARD